MANTPSLFGLDAASAISDFEQILLSNSGEDAFESAIKLLAAKLVAEIEAEQAESTDFKIFPSPEQTYDKIQALYKKAVRRWPALNGGSSTLDITPPHLVRSLRPLLGWKLVGSDLSHLDAALERLVSKSSKGELGQYFTPREVVRLCVKILHPSPTDVVIDPACGSAGFLFEASEQARSEFGKVPRCLGIDFSAKAAKVATLLSGALRHYSIEISKANSLDGRDYVKSHPPAWKLFIDEHVPDETEPQLQVWGAWSRLQCTLLFTNPPFAGDIDDVAMLAAYDAPRARGPKKTVSREHLFLERAVKLLRPGGRLAIVLPQGLLANSSAAYLRKWVHLNTRILGVVGLHPHTFLPHTGVKTSILFLEKKDRIVRVDPAYTVFFATSKRPGKDSSGRPEGETDFEAITHAFMTFLSEQKLPWAKKLSSPSREYCDYEPVDIREVLEADRLDPEFYDPAARQTLKRMRRTAKGCIRDYVVCEGIAKFRSKAYNEISYIDISSVDGRTGLVTPTRISSEEAPSRASFLVRPGDVLVSMVRPDRGTVALVTDIGMSPLVASNGFCVLRPITIEPEVLFAFCKSISFRTVLARAATSSMYPTVNEADILSIPFPLPTTKTRTDICRGIHDALTAIQTSYKAMETAIGSITEF